MIGNTRFKLYASNGTTLVYSFPLVQETNAPQSITKTSIIEGIRGQGCLVLVGATGSWDLMIRGIFVENATENEYETINDDIDAIEAAIPIGTKFVLKIEKDNTTAYQYNVIRVSPIQYDSSLRIDEQKYTVVLKANAW